jgi:Protein of unknown function (DUF3489)
MRATGWQPHTVRGFFAAVVRKKLGLRLESEKMDGERVYRIVDSPTARESGEYIRGPLNLRSSGTFSKERL